MYIPSPESLIWGGSGQVDIIPGGLAELRCHSKSLSRNVRIQNINVLTESLALPWEYRPTSKWPTMIFFCLNKQMVPKDHPVKFFSIFFRGKGGIFALKVRVFSKKTTKFN